MDSNTHSTGPPAPPEDLAGLPAVVAELEAEDLDQLTDTTLTQDTLALQQWRDRIEGQFLRRLAAVDARRAAGADRGVPAPSTAGWLRNRLRMSAAAAYEAVRTARALFRGPLTGTADALLAGAISPAHARVLAQGTHQLPDQVTREAEPVLVETATQVDPPRLRQAVGYLLQIADPEGADAARERRHARRGLWLSATFDHMVAVSGLLEAEAGHIVRTALEPLARPSDADDTRQGGQRTADALTELARRALEAGGLPKTGGVHPQLLVMVDLDSLAGRPGGSGGALGWAEPLEAEACRRLACDGAVTRVLVTRQPGGQELSDQPRGSSEPAGHGLHDCPLDPDPPELEGLRGRLRAAVALLPPVLGGAPSQPLDVGRATRVVSPAQRAALAVRDGGCVFPDCDRPLAWCDGHHLWHWTDGGPTELWNLALVCRAHHRQVHEGGWHLARGPDGRFTAAPGQRTRRPAAQPAHATSTPVWATEPQVFPSQPDPDALPDPGRSSGGSAERITSWPP
jgi:Domain of unknown function (DUF222)